MKKKIILSILFLLQIASLAPVNYEVSFGEQNQDSVYVNQYNGSYYNGVSSSLKGENLLNSLHSVISKNTVSLGYSNVKKSVFAQTDMKPGTNYIWDMYSDYEYEPVGSYPSSNNVAGVDFNREHTVPQSWFYESEPMRSDIFHLYPTDSRINLDRGSYPHGDTVSGTGYVANSHLCKLGKSTYSGIGTVFEVADEYKGDFARTYFYMTARYCKINSGESGTPISKWKSNAVFKDSFPYLTDFALTTYLKWAKDDPVSEKEINRNEAIFKIQKNRNPFVDHQTWIFDIWDQDFDYGKTDPEPPPTPPTPPVIDDNKELIEAFESLETRTALSSSFSITNGETVTINSVNLSYVLYIDQNTLTNALNKGSLVLYVCDGNLSDDQILQNSYLIRTRTSFQVNIELDKLTTCYTACYGLKIGGNIYLSKPSKNSVKSLANKYQAIHNYTDYKGTFLNYLGGLE